MSFLSGNDLSNGVPLSWIDPPLCRHYADVPLHCLHAAGSDIVNVAGLAHLAVGVFAFYHAIVSLSQAYTGKIIVPLGSLVLRHVRMATGPSGPEDRNRTPKASEPLS